MSRLAIRTLENAPDEARPYLKTALENSGFIPNLLGILANAPTALETYVTVSAINARTGLTLPEREVVQMIAATTHGCAFCVAGHTVAAQYKARLPAHEVDALREGRPLEDARLAAVARFTSAVIGTRGRVGDEALQVFLAAGFSPANALEVVLGVSLATLCNFANNLAETPLNPELAEYRWTPRPA